MLEGENTCNASVETSGAYVSNGYTLYHLRAPSSPRKTRANGQIPFRIEMLFRSPKISMSAELLNDPLASIVIRAMRDHLRYTNRIGKSFFYKHLRPRNCSIRISTFKFLSTMHFSCSSLFFPRTRASTIRFHLGQGDAALIYKSTCVEVFASICRSLAV